MVVEESQPANWKAAATPEQLRERLKQGVCVRERDRQIGSEWVRESRKQGEFWF
jgi:hypothetical protein